MGYLTSTIDLSAAERRQHIYVIGATGTGKSTLLRHMMQEDISNGRGFALIDPHGDLARSIADAIPKDRIQDTILFEPLAEKVIRFNPLVPTEPFHRATTAAHIVSAFKHIWQNSWGARLEYILTNSLRLLLESPGTSLVDLPRLLVDGRYRNQLLKQCDDPYIEAFWKDEYDKYSDRLRGEAIAPIQNKVGQFANNPILRDIISGASTIDIFEIMNTRKILVCDLSKRIGAEPSHLLGALLVTGFAQAAQARDTIPEEQRQDFTLYVDEFQNFATESFTTILSEARKYRLNLVLAHQYLSQLPEGMRDAVLGNAATKIVFRVGTQDAPIFATEFQLKDLSGVLRPERVAQLPNHTAYLNGKEFTTDKPEIPKGSIESIRRNTAARYARPRCTSNSSSLPSSSSVAGTTSTRSPKRRRQPM